MTTPVLEPTKPKERMQYGLKADCLSFSETIAQSVANIAPTVTPVLIVPGVFAVAGNGTWISYLLATIGLILVGFNINQFAKRSASPGSLYAYITKGLGVNTGFIAGWSAIVAYSFTAISLMAGCVNYSQVLLGGFHLTIYPIILASLGMLGVWFVAFKDIKISAQLMLLLEGASMGVILILCAVIYFKHGTLIDLKQLQLDGANFNGIKGGLILAIFSFVGYESSTALGSEAKNPLKNIPKAVILSAMISGAFFMLTCYASILGFSTISAKLSASSDPLGDISTNLGMPWIGTIVAIGAVISTLACSLASVNAASRVVFMMSRHGILHPHLAKVHGSNKTPHYAIAIVSIISLLILGICLMNKMAIMDIFNDISTIATYGFLMLYLLISIAAPVYLKNRGELSVGAVVISVLGVLFMIPAIISTFYPTPAAPIDKFPIYFLIYLAVGALWIAYIRRVSNPSIVSEITKDLEIIHAEFSDLRK